VFVVGAETGVGQSPQEDPGQREEVNAPGTQAAVPARKPQQRSGELLSSVQSLAMTIVIAAFVITFIVQAFQIPSESMENTLLIGDYLLVDKVRFGDGGVWGRIEPYSRIQRGDIIVFRYPIRPSQHFVKRVVALPGDRVRLVNKQVWVNGQLADGKYAIFKSRMRDSFRDDFPRSGILSPNVDAKWWLQMRKLVDRGELIVPDGHYFVLGDNRDESLDSRYWGFVPRENVIGRPLLIYLSIRRPVGPGPFEAPSSTASDKLSNLAYTLVNSVRDLRWDRTFRLVK
jgi:signal peptidase I